jgi:dienelactone hydrolase
MEIARTIDRAPMVVRVDIYLEKSIRTLSVKPKDSCYLPLLDFRVAVTSVPKAKRSMKPLVFVLLLVFTISARSQTTSDEAARAALFQYNDNARVVVKETSSEKRGEVTVRDIKFSGPGGHEVAAYLVTPSGDGPFAAILWAHWLGEEKSNRTQFLDEAVELAHKGAVSLLIDAMWSTPEWFGKRVPEQDHENSIRQVIEMRRAADLLLSQPSVDKTRTAFVGHDFGAMYGILMAGVDRRLKNYVFIAATQSLNDWAFLGPQPKSKSAYLKENADLELTDYLQLNDANKFFQFGKADFYISQADAAVLFKAAKEPKQRKIYDAGHDMQSKEIVADRADWLIMQLKLATAP